VDTHKPVILIGCAFCALGGVAASADEAIWRFDAAQGRCVQENISVYETSDMNPVVIVLSACPETDLAKVLRASSENSGLFSVNDGDRVLVLSHEELACFGELELPDEGIVEVRRGSVCE